MKDIIDITVPLQSDMPIWPRVVGPRLTQTKSIELGDSANASRLDCDVHTGTHVETPRHFFNDGITVERLSLSAMIGPAMVAYLPGVDVITANDLVNLGLSSGVKRLLLRTHNSELWEKAVKEFRKDYVALTDDAAQWIVDQDMQLVGVDYLSIQPYGNKSHTHQILLSGGVIIIEGLNLANVHPRIYELTCLPLKLTGAEAAPARAVLRRLSSHVGDIL